MNLEAIHLDGKTYPIEEFELGELEFVEEYVGLPMSQLGERSMRASVAFLTVLKRRENPEYTVDDARKENLTVFQGDEEQPPEKKGKAGAKRPPQTAA